MMTNRQGEPGRHVFRNRRVAAVGLAIVLLLSACAGDETKKPNRADGSKKEQLVVQVASYDLAAGPAARFMAGLLTPDQELVLGGDAAMRFAFLGTEKVSNEGNPGPEVGATFLAVPPEAKGREEPDSAKAVPHPPGGAGVFAARVAFDKPGFWGVQVAIPKKLGRPNTGTAVFQVLAKHKVPAPGDDAPRTENLTVASTDVPREAIDSRASGGNEVPDPELHSTTIKAAIEQKAPVLVVFSTPTYCISRFCGPITDMVADLAKKYPERAKFVHVEIWRDKQANAINSAAAQWLLRDEDLTEPWVFLIGADGKIVGRWDNVATAGEIEPLLQALPSN